MPLEWDCDLRIHGRIDTRSHDNEQVNVEVETNEVVPLFEPDGLITGSDISHSRTLEVQCRDWHSMTLDPDREPRIHRSDTGTTIVGEYEGERAYVKQHESLTLRFPGDIHPADIPVTTDQVATLPSELFKEKQHVMVRDAVLTVIACYYYPLYDPFFPPICGDVVVDFVKETEERPTIEAVPVEPIDSTKEPLRLMELHTEDTWIKLTVSTHEALTALETACCQLLEADTATAALSPDVTLRFDVIRNAVPYLSWDVLKITTSGADETDDPSYVRLVRFAITVANAVMNADSSDGIDGIVLEPLQHGLASIEDEQLIEPRDPYEGYCGIIQGCSFVTTGDPFAEDRWQVTADDLKAWALLDRDYDGEGLIKANHDWRGEVN